MRGQAFLKKIAIDRLRGGCALTGRDEIAADKPAMPPPPPITSRVSRSSKSAAFFIVEEESRTECTGDVFVVATALCRRNKRRDADRAASLQLLLRRRRGILCVSRLRSCWFATGQLGVFRNGFQI